MSQEQQVQEFIRLLSDRFNTIDKRLNNIEGSEYPATNYYAMMYGTNAIVTVTITLANTSYQVLGMSYRNLKGFTALANTLVCDKAGVYRAHYSLGVELAGTTTLSAYVSGDALATTDAISTLTGVSGTRGWLSKTVLLDLDVGDVVALYVKTTIGTTTAAINNAAVLLHRLDDN